MKKNTDKLSSWHGKSSEGISKARSAKKIQSVLTFPSNNALKSTTCPICGMTYYSYVSKDKELHEKYHYNHLNGIQWADHLICRMLKSFTMLKEEKVEVGKGLKKITKVKSTSHQVKIVTIDKGVTKQISKVQELLDMVNKELNAPADSGQWKDSKLEGSKAYILVIENRAVGVCITDIIEDIENQGRWMIFSNQSIVPDQVNKQIQIGISRIWIAPNWRRLGLAKHLLNVILGHSVYGLALKKQNVGFSQPSYSGGLLAKSFNGVTHKSGEILIPVYLEI